MLWQNRGRCIEIFVLTSFILYTLEIGNDTYFYHFEYGPRFSHDVTYGEDVTQKSDICESDHGDDLPFTFGMPFANVSLYKKARFTEREEEIASDWMKYLANFATHGWVLWIEILL